MWSYRNRFDASLIDAQFDTEEEVRQYVFGEFQERNAPLAGCDEFIEDDNEVVFVEYELDKNDDVVIKKSSKPTLESQLY